MEKVTIIGPKTVMDRAVRELHGLKIIHITDHRKDEFDIGNPFERADELSRILVSVRAISAALGISGKKELLNGFRAVGVKNLAELGRAVRKLNAEVDGLLSGRKEAEGELKKLGEREAQLLCIRKLGLRPDDFSGYKSLSYFLGRVKDPQAVRKSLLAVTDGFELFSAEQDSGNIVALFIEAGKKSEAAELLARHGFAELPLAEIKDVTGPVSSALEAVARKKGRLQRQIESADKSASVMVRKWNDFLLLSEQLLAAELEKAEAPLKFGVSRNAFIIRGWVPARELRNLESRLSKVTGERIYVESGLPQHGDKVPVLLKNPGLARPFEFFMRLYSLPGHDEIDPTIFTLVTFPLFFGFILGDVGYGLVTFFMLLWLKKKIPGAASLVNVVIPAAASSVIFGFLFGEVFGFEQAFGFEFPRLINRVHDINGLLSVSVVIGLLHLNLGFLLGFLNELHHKGFFKAFAAKLSWMLLQVGIGVVALSATGRTAVPVFAGIAIAAISVVLIYIGESIRGLIELPSLFSNALSYARLAAVGLSSVSLAVVINEMAEGIAGSGAAGMAGAIVLLFVGHTVNLALGLLGSFLHSLRLHYVEFFTKFFEGGAIPFRPFGLRNRH